MYCVNHLLLPMMQGWLRHPATSISTKTTLDLTTAAAFRQYTGLTSDLVVEYITRLANKGQFYHQKHVILYEPLDIKSDFISFL